MKKETVFKAAIILGFLALFARYFSVQVQHGAEYDQMALRNHFRYIAIPAPRGTIWSAEGSTLASNHSSMDLVVYKEEMKSPARLKARLIQLLSYRKDEILQHWRQMASAPSYIPYPILSDLEESEVPMIELEKVNFPELSIVKPMRRMYPFADLFSHALGYVAESSPEDLRLEPDLQAGDWIGKTGLERSYERHLKGASGRWAVVVDSQEREAARYLVQKAADGTPLQTTLRIALQQKARELFGEDTGAAVVMDIATGDVLCYYSAPTYPTQPPTSSALLRERWRQVLTDPDRPLMDRLAQGTYAPGSVFKAILTIAALEEGVWSPQKTIVCTGGFKFGDKVFRCWNRSGHGAVDLRRAIAVSCDCYFYQLGLYLGVERISRWAKAFGLDHRTGVDLPFEKSGLVPSEEWSLRTRGTPWYPGETVSLAIGQGPVTLTPLKACQIYAGIAAGGRMPVPRLTHESPPAFVSVPISPETDLFLREALGDVVASPGGTAHKIDGEPTIAGKTGTSQLVAEVAGKSHPKEHAWFVGYAPRENPRLAVAVLVEHGGHGSEAAAPIAAELLREALK